MSRHESQARELTLLTADAAEQILLLAQKPFNKVVRKQKLDHLVWTREAGFAIQLLTKDERFAVCPAQSIIDAVTNLAFVGLTLNPARQHATILAKYSKQRRRYEAALEIMYRGLMHLATQAGVHGIKSEVIYQLDQFRYGSSHEKGDWYEYEMNMAPRGTPVNPFLGVFVAAKMPLGDLKVEWLPATQILSSRDASESYLDSEGKPSRYSPWVKWFDEMAKKTGIKRAQKRWEEMITNSEQWQRFLQAVQIDNQSEGVIAPRDTDIESTAVTVELISVDQAKEIEKQIETAGHHERDKEVYMGRICTAYGVKSFAEIPASKYEEIVTRIKAAASKESAS